MRLIGHLKSEPAARTFSEFLYINGIKSQVEAERDGTWGLWIHNEDDLDRSRHLLQSYLTNPDDLQYRDVGRRAREMQEREKEHAGAAARKFIEAREIFSKTTAYGLGALTICLIVVSVVVWLIDSFGRGVPELGKFVDALWISNYKRLRSFPEIRQGEIWRIFTPIFLHAPSPMFLHILFNMLWLKDLGSIVEARQSSLQLGLLVLVISGASNVAQYLVEGPNFCGMSGVVYGLFGYIWIKGKFDPGSGYYVDSTTVTWMLIWFFICFTGFMPIANTVHAVGLGIGIVWGYLSALAKRL